MVSARKHKRSSTVRSTHGGLPISRHLHFGFQGGQRRWLLVGALLLLALYLVVTYGLIVSPFSSWWRGIYGVQHYPSEYNIRGIDVSHHQGKINWEAVRRDEIGDVPVSFAFVKATEGCSWVDGCFKYNFNETRENGILRGAYHFFRPKYSASGQARHFIRTVALEAGDLPPVLDVEVSEGLSSQAVADSALVWLSLVEAHYGVSPIVYSNYKFRTQYLSDSRFDDYPYWIAHYYEDTLQYTGAWKFWQNTDRGRISGIKGFVDINCYNGSMYDLKKLTIKE